MICPTTFPSPSMAVKGKMTPINWEHQYKTIHHKCMTLRPFTIDDAPIILSWIKDKTAFRKWSADRYPVYPPKPEDMVAQYESDVIFPSPPSTMKGKSWDISYFAIQILRRLLSVSDSSSLMTNCEARAMANRCCNWPSRKRKRNLVLKR